MPTLGQLRDFKSSDIWEMIVEELLIRIENLRSEMEDPDGNLSIDKLRQMQGGIRAFREVKDTVLDYLMTQVEERKDVNGLE